MVKWIKKWLQPPNEKLEEDVAQLRAELIELRRSFRAKVIEYDGVLFGKDRDGEFDHLAGRPSWE